MRIKRLAGQDKLQANGLSASMKIDYRISIPTMLTLMIQYTRTYSSRIVEYLYETPGTSERAIFSISINHYIF
jgi:hypothetical protein